MCTYYLGGAAAIGTTIVLQDCIIYLSMSIRYIKVCVYLNSLLKRRRSAWLTALAKTLAAELQHHPKHDADVFKAEMGLGKDQDRSRLTPTVGRQGQDHRWKGCEPVLLTISHLHTLVLALVKNNEGNRR